VLTPRLIQSEEDYDTLKEVESSRMSWCLADVLNIHGDQGLSAGNGLWGPARAPVIFPDMPASRVPDRAEHNMDNNYPIPGSFPTPVYDPAVPMSYEDVEAAKQKSNQFQQVSYQSGDANLRVLKPSSSSAPAGNNPPAVGNKRPMEPNGSANAPGIQNGMYR
jgi:hypothetical protein